MVPISFSRRQRPLDTVQDSGAVSPPILLSSLRSDLNHSYMMYQKAILFNDTAAGLAILNASHPRKAKSLGRKVHNFSNEVWDAERERIVLHGTVLKFRADPALREKLLATGDRELVEASPLDAIWGIGFAEANAEDLRADWGLNLLGKAIMNARKILCEEDKLST